MSLLRRFGLLAALLAVCAMAGGLGVDRFELSPTDGQIVCKDAAEGGADAKGVPASVAVLSPSAPSLAELAASGWLDEVSELSSIEFSVEAHSPRSPPLFLS